MTQQEYIAFEICIKQIKQFAIKNQLYEFAALSRDLERDLTADGQEITSWHRVTTLDSFQYYDRIERLINQYTFSNIDDFLRSNFKDLHDVVMRPVIRQEIISKILGDYE